MDNRMLERFSWVKDRYGVTPRLAGNCECGRSLTRNEYEYHGGSHGYYTCAECSRRYMVDINGVMWELTA